MPPYVAPAWMNVAVRELGVSEKPGDDHERRIVSYHAATTLGAKDDETPWCSSFVNWCLAATGITGTRSAAARSWLTWGRQATEEDWGAVAIFRRGSGWQGHVGFNVGVAGSRVLCLGGNQGNRVSVAAYPQMDLLDLRWPPVPS
jgi:uncharacterized protein (TIGR02594 family)